MMTSPSDLLTSALTYAGFGWAVFPVHGIREGKCTCGRANCSSPGKHPLTRHGHRDSTSDSAKITDWWKRFPWANIGIATGEVSGRLLVIDLDCKPEQGIDGEESWRELAKDFPATIEVLTGGGGRHFYLNYPDSVLLKSSAGLIGPGIDVRADGGYVLAPPSIHVSGRRYEWEASSDPMDGGAVAPAPAWLLNGNGKRLSATIEVALELLSIDKVQELRSALAFIDSNERDVWLKVGMALHSTHAGQQAYGIWTEWSQQSPKFDPRDQQRTWQSFTPNGNVSLSTIFWLAKQNGWVEPDAQAVVSSISASEPISQPDPIDDELIHPPGMLGEIVDYIVATARRPQPEFAVNAALALAGTILGQRFITESELRTNLYLISVGATASGKDHPRKIVKNILNEAGLYDMIGGENLASGQGLLARVKRTPVVLFQLDEFGLMLQALQQKNAGRHNKEILINMIRLFSSADSVFVGTEYADQTNRPTVRIEYPCVSIHATTTPETFYAALESKNVVDGFLNRFLVVDLTEKPRPHLEERGLYPEIPSAILAWIEHAITLNLPKGNLARYNAPTPIVVPTTPEAAAHLREFSEYAEQQCSIHAKTGIDAIWSRAFEHAAKIALICACAVNIATPKIELPHAQWAVHFVGHHTEQLVKQVNDRIADTDFERITNEFLEAIRNTGERGVTERDMNRYKPFCSQPPKERKPIIETLMIGGKIALTKVKTAGRARIAYVACAPEKKETDDK